MGYCVKIRYLNPGAFYYFKKFLSDGRPRSVMSYHKHLATEFPDIKSACDVVKRLDPRKYKATIIPFPYKTSSPVRPFFK